MKSSNNSVCVLITSLDKFHLDVAFTDRIVKDTTTVTSIETASQRVP